jgi:hypothetical protein
MKKKIVDDAKWREVVAYIPKPITEASIAEALDRAYFIMTQCFRGSHRFNCDGSKLVCTRCGMIFHLTMDQRILMTTGVYPIVQKSIERAERQVLEFEGSGIQPTERYTNAFERFEALRKTLEDSPK